jgi:hypothetical protein
MNLQKDFKTKVIQPYKKRKKLLDINILEKVLKINRKHLFYSLVLLVFFLINRKYFMFIALTLGSAIFSFYHSKVNKSPLDFKMALFLGLFITREYGILFTLVFFIISDIIPALLGGESMQGPDLFFFAWYFIVNAAVYFFPAVPMTTLGPVLVVIEATGSFFINSFFGYPGMMAVFISALAILVRIIYFLTLGRLLEVLFRFI